MEQLIKTKEEMKGVEGIINRLEEEQRIENVSKKIKAIVENKKNDIKVMKAEMKLLWEEKDYNKTIISSIQDQMKLILIEQVTHYYWVLAMANDTWQEGMGWVIKCLWSLD